MILDNMPSRCSPVFDIIRSLMSRFRISIFVSAALLCVYSSLGYTLNVSANISEDIPSPIAEQFSVFSPSVDQIVVKSDILIKGRNLMLTPVFINGEAVPLREDGRFYKVMPIPQKGANSIYISVWSPKHDYLTIRRTIFLEDAPPNVDRLGDQKRIGILILNSKFVDLSPKNLDLTTSVSRYQFAYLLSKINVNSVSISTEDIRFSDVSPTASIMPTLRYVSAAQLISDFPDGTFRPEAKISKLEFIVGIVKALNLPLPETSGNTINYTDVPKGHWANPYIIAAAKYGFIQSNGKLNLNSDLSYTQYISMLAKMPIIQDYVAIQKIRATNDKTVLDRHFTALMRATSVPSNRLESNAVNLKSPSNNTIVVDTQIKFSGIVSPVQPTISIYSQSVSVDKSGSFSSDIALQPGKNEIAVVTQTGNITRTIFQLPGFKDMKGHWAEIILAKMRFANLVEDVPYLYPKSELTNELIAYYLAQLLNSDEYEEVVIPDVNQSSTFYPHIQKVVGLKVMNLDSNGRFLPKAKLSRSDMLAIFSRALHLPIPKNIPKRSLYVDLSSSSPNYPYIYALQNSGFLAKSGRIFPNRTATKIELLSLMSRTEFVKIKLDMAFPHD